MIRSILSVLAGFVAMSVLVMIATVISARLMLGATDMESMMKIKPTPAFIVVNLGYSSLFAVFGGFLTTVIAARAPMKHALALAALLLVGAIVSFFADAGTGGPTWYRVMLIPLGPACALLGGYFQLLRLDSSPQPA